MSVDVIIPVYKPNHKFERLLKMLVKQTNKPNNIIILNTEVLPEYSTALIRERIEKTLCGIHLPGTGEINIAVHSIKKDEFDHGGTRHYGASLSNADYLLYMTQDAIPKNEFLIEKLLASFSDEMVAAAYARQLADETAKTTEAYTRIFNYPEKSFVKSKEDKAKLGIKTYFCSNVCAMYQREVFQSLGGFVTRTIFNEDMIYAAKAIEADYKIAYVSEALVIHSHNYSTEEQFHRNFDLGVSHNEYKEIFSSVPSESEGIKMVKQTMAFLLDRKEYLSMIEYFFESAAKYVGYFMGKHYSSLPKSLVIWSSMNKGYWRK